MNEKNIETIKDQLLSLGLATEIEFDLRANICLLQDQFQVSYRQVKEQDIINSVFYFDSYGLTVTFNADIFIQFIIVII